MRDAAFMFGNLLLVNLIFEWVTGIKPEFGGTVFNAIFIFLGIETYYNMKRYMISTEC